MDVQILFVDDALFMRRVIRTALNECGFENLLEAAEGDEAVRIYRESRPGIVLLDITMPGKSGLDVLDEIMKIDPEAVVIMCSAIGQEKTIEQAVRKGASDYITKPFKSTNLAGIIKKYL